MGNTYDCCRKASTLQQSHELILKITKDENNLNRTIKRNCIIYRKKENSENLVTEAVENNNYKCQDDFMKNYANSINSISRNFSFESEGQDVSVIGNNFVEGGLENFPVLLLNISRESKPNVLPQLIETLKLNPMGLIPNNNKTNKNNITTYFGIEKLNKNKNDIILPLDPIELEEIISTNLNNKNNKSHSEYSIKIFSIKFDVESNKYLIKDFLSGISVFAQIKNETILKNNSIINIGDVYLLITLGEAEINQIEMTSNNLNNILSESCNSELINIKIYNKKSQVIHDPINFQPTKNAIRIGRSKENEITLQNEILISKTHCTIQYDKVVGWTIRDGYNKKTQEYIQSTNGTWIYISDNYPISDNMIFRCGSLQIDCSILN